MSQPGYLWPEPGCSLSGSVLTMKQARWAQRQSFLSLAEPAKWMVVVYVDNVIVHGQVPATVTPAATTYADEMPLSQKTFTIDLAGYGVDASTPLYPTVKVEQYAATAATATTWFWGSSDIEFASTPLRIYIDSNGGVPKPATYPPSQDWRDGNSWMPLSRGFYDEGAHYPADFNYTTATNNVPTLGAPGGSFGMQFQTMLPSVSIDGIQVWTPPSFFPPNWWLDSGWVPIEIIIRLWEGSGAVADTNFVRYQVAELGPGWTNILWTDTPGNSLDGPYPAKTRYQPGVPTAGNPYPLITNPAHDGWYTVGYQTNPDGTYRTGPAADVYLPLYPEHDKVFMDDNYPALFNLRNRGAPVEEKGPEWAPMAGFGSHLMIGPIVTYTPIYPVPGMFVPQIYRRVGLAQ